MSHLTDGARAAVAETSSTVDTPVRGQTFDEVLTRLPLQRRAVLKTGLGATLASVFGSGLLAGCRDDDRAADGAVGQQAMVHHAINPASFPPQAGHALKFAQPVGDQHGAQLQRLGGEPEIVGADGRALQVAQCAPPQCLIA